MKKEPYDTGGRGMPPVSQKVEVLKLSCLQKKKRYKERYNG